MFVAGGFGIEVKRVSGRGSIYLSLAVAAQARRALRGETVLAVVAERRAPALARRPRNRGRHPGHVEHPVVREAPVLGERARPARLVQQARQGPHRVVGVARAHPVRERARALPTVVQVRRRARARRGDQRGVPPVPVVPSRTDTIATGPLVRNYLFS